jgi:hypothetical protein
MSSTDDLDSAIIAAEVKVAAVEAKVAATKAEKARAWRPNSPDWSSARKVACKPIWM